MRPCLIVDIIDFTGTCGHASNHGHDVDALRQGLLSAEAEDPATGHVMFDTAADMFLAAIVREYGTTNAEFVLPPSTLTLHKQLGTGSFGCVYAGQ